MPPHGLERIVAFVNTLDVSGPSDDLASPESLRAWLTAHALIAPEGAPQPEATPGPEGAPQPEAASGSDDLVAAIAVRGALREILDGGTGHEAVAAALQTLDRAAARAPLRVRFDAEHGATLEPVAPGLSGAFARMFADVAATAADGTWARLRICRSPDCRWAFYDGSKNRSRVWCTMAGCGSRAKSRAYRRRARNGARLSPLP